MRDLRTEYYAQCREENRFTLFNKETKDSHHKKYIELAQVFGVFLVTRLVMVVSGITFVHIPWIDGVLGELARKIV